MTPLSRSKEHVSRVAYRYNLLAVSRLVVDLQVPALQNNSDERPRVIVKGSVMITPEKMMDENPPSVTPKHNVPDHQRVVRPADQLSLTECHAVAAPSLLSHDQAVATAVPRSALFEL